MPIAFSSAELGIETAMIAQALLALGGVCAAVYWVGFCYRGESAVRSVIKTASVACLGLAGWIAGAEMSLIAALGFCALGDFALSRNGERLFLMGVAAFALGHLFYITTFVGHPESDTARLALQSRLSIVIGLGVFGLGMAAVLYRMAGTMRLAVVAYVPVIMAMGGAALVLPFSGVFVLAVCGAALFVLSDLILSLELFVLPAGSPILRLTPFAVWVAYWLAQALLLAGLVPA
jgi:uncharacterized membrane protein YhhN